VFPTGGYHLQRSGVPRANTFFNTSLKVYFQNVIKPWSKLLWVRYWVPRIIFPSCRWRKPKKVGKHCYTQTFAGKHCYTQTFAQPPCHVLRWLTTGTPKTTYEPRICSMQHGYQTCNTCSAIWAHHPFLGGVVQEAGVSLSGQDTGHLLSANKNANGNIQMTEKQVALQLHTVTFLKS